MPRCWDVGMEGCWGAQMGATGMEGCQDAGCWDVGMWGCRVAGVWGWRGAGVQHIGTPGCREMEIRGDAGMRTRWDVRTPGCRDTAAGQREAVRARPGPCTYSAARSTPGKRVTAKGAVLWDGSSPRLSSHSSFPTTGASLNPWPAGRRGWLGGGTATPMGPASSGVLGRREGWVPSPTREAGPDDDVAELGVLVQDEVFIWGVLGEPWCEGVGSGVLSRTRG